MPSNNGRCELLMQKSEEWEEAISAKLQEYCLNQQDHNVIYLHSKGSFNSGEYNNRLRRLITSAALSDECNEGLTTTQCNICSARFSPIPHWHTPGNMWTAQCSYVANLFPILQFGAKVSEIAQIYLRDMKNFTHYSGPDIGTGRFVNEHWVHTHHDVNPCDVFTDTNLIYGYPNLNYDLRPFSLKKAPRIFPLQSIERTDFYSIPPGEQVVLRYRLFELEELYNATPADDSFVWFELYGLL